MSAPRRPIGRQHPGTIPATRLRVLGAEIADPVQLRYGKLLFADEAVVDIAAVDGAVVVMVQGSAPEAFRVELFNATAGAVPDRTRLSWRCSCDRGERVACKHVVAALLSVADQVALDPGLIDRWGDRTALADNDADGGVDVDGRVGGGIDPEPIDDKPVAHRSVEIPRPAFDPIGHLVHLQAPLPEITAVEHIDFAAMIIGGDDGLVDETSLRTVLHQTFEFLQ